MLSENTSPAGGSLVSPATPPVPSTDAVPLSPSPEPTGKDNASGTPSSLPNVVTPTNSPIVELPRSGEPAKLFQHSDVHSQAKSRQAELKELRNRKLAKKLGKEISETSDSTAPIESSMLTNFFLRQKQQKKEWKEKQHETLEYLHSYKSKDAPLKGRRGLKKFQSGYTTMTELDAFYSQQRQAKTKWREQYRLSKNQLHTYKGRTDPSTREQLRTEAPALVSPGGSTEESGDEFTEVTDASSMAAAFAGMKQYLEETLAEAVSCPLPESPQQIISEILASATVGEAPSPPLLPAVEKPEGANDDQALQHSHDESELLKQDESLASDPSLSNEEADEGNDAVVIIPPIPSSDTEENQAEDVHDAQGEKHESGDVGTSVAEKDLAETDIKPLRDTESTKDETTSEQSDTVADPERGHTDEMKVDESAVEVNKDPAHESEKGSGDVVNDAFDIDGVATDVSQDVATPSDSATPPSEPTAEAESEIKEPVAQGFADVEIPKEELTVSVVSEDESPPPSIDKSTVGKMTESKLLDKAAESFVSPEPVSSEQTQSSTDAKTPEAAVTGSKGEAEKKGETTTPATTGDETNPSKDLLPVDAGAERDQPETKPVPDEVFQIPKAAGDELPFDIAESVEKLAELEQPADQPQRETHAAQTATAPSAKVVTSNLRDAKESHNDQDQQVDNPETGTPDNHKPTTPPPNTSPKEVAVVPSVAALVASGVSDKTEQLPRTKKAPRRAKAASKSHRKVAATTKEVTVPVTPKVKATRTKSPRSVSLRHDKSRSPTQKAVQSPHGTPPRTRTYRSPRTSPRRTLQREAEAGSDVCSSKWTPNVHLSQGGCERCLELASQDERDKFLSHGHHHRVMIVRGGCSRGCSCYPRGENEAPVRLCRKCFYDTHTHSRGDFVVLSIR